MTVERKTMVIIWPLDGLIVLSCTGLGLAGTLLVGYIAGNSAALKITGIKAGLCREDSNGCGMINL